MENKERMGVTMNRQEMNQMALDILREEKRANGVIATAEALDQVAAVLDTVEVDRKYLKNCIRRALHSVSGNPLNAVLGLIGLQMIRKDADIKIFESDDSHSELESMLKLNEKALHSTISKIASDLANYEREVKEDSANKVNKINDLIDKMDKQEQVISQLKTDKKAQMLAVADRMQYMLCVLGPDKSDNTLEKQVYELMEDLDIKVYWDANEAPLSDAVMFTELKTAEVEKHRMKPCLICKGEVIAKGVRFCKEDAVDEQ